MKKIILIKTIAIMMLVTSCVKSQNNSNKLTFEEYSNIKINGVTLNSINNTRGDHQALNNLFNVIFEYEEIDFPDKYRELSSNNLEMSFTANDSQSNYEIDSIELRTNNVELEVSGKLIKIGDSVNNLGIINANTDTSIIYEINPDSDQFFLKLKNFVSITFDKDTNLITKIEFIVLT